MDIKVNSYMRNPKSTNVDLQGLIQIKHDKLLSKLKFN
jgi:hypothetical protein